MLAVNPLPDTSFVYIFINSVGCLFIPLMVSFIMQNLFSLIWSHCLFLPFFFFCYLRRQIQKILLRQMSKPVLPMFSSKNLCFQVFKSLIPLEFLIALSTWIQNSHPFYPLRQWLSYFLNFMTHTFKNENCCRFSIFIIFPTNVFSTCTFLNSYFNLWCSKQNQRINDSQFTFCQCKQHSQYNFSCVQVFGIKLICI